MRPASFTTHDSQPTTHARRSAFTLIEMLTTVAVLIILLGLMIDLAGYVRNRSANDLTRQVLAGLDVAMSQYISAHQMMPAAHPFATDANLNEDEDALLQSALENNRDFVAALKADNLLRRRRFLASAGLDLRRRHPQRRLGHADRLHAHQPPPDRDGPRRQRLLLLRRPRPPIQNPRRQPVQLRSGKWGIAAGNDQDPIPDEMTNAQTRMTNPG